MEVVSLFTQWPFEIYDPHKRKAIYVPPSIIVQKWDGKSPIHADEKEMDVVLGELVSRWQKLSNLQKEKGSLLKMIQTALPTKPVEEVKINGLSVEAFEQEVLVSIDDYKKPPTPIVLDEKRPWILAHRDCKDAIVKKWKPCPPRRPPLSDRELLEVVTEHLQDVCQDLERIKKRMRFTSIDDVKVQDNQIQ